MVIHSDMYNNNNKKKNEHDQNFPELWKYFKNANLTIQGLKDEINFEGIKNIFNGIIAGRFSTLDRDI